MSEETKPDGAAGENLRLTAFQVIWMDDRALDTGKEVDLRPMWKKAGVKL